MTSPWTPPRPDTQTAVWEKRPTRSAGTEPPSLSDGASSDDASTPPVDDRRGGTDHPRTPTGPARPLAAARAAVQARWQRASRGRRTGTGLAALLLVAGLVVGLGVAAQPTYPALGAADEPIAGTDAFGRTGATGTVVLDDLRALPTTATWTTDLRAALAPLVTRDCVSFRQVGTVGDDVLIGTSWLGGDSTGCAFSIGRVARLDPRTGKVVWVADIRAALGVDDPQYVAVYPDDDGREATVALARQVGTPAVRLDLTTGEVLGTIVPPDDITLSNPDDIGATGTDGDGSGSDGDSADDGDADGGNARRRQRRSLCDHPGRRRREPGRQRVVGQRGAVRDHPRGRRALVDDGLEWLARRGDDPAAVLRRQRRHDVQLGRRVPLRPVPHRRPDHSDLERRRRLDELPDRVRGAAVRRADGRRPDQRRHDHGSGHALARRPEGRERDSRDRRPPVRHDDGRRQRRQRPGLAASAPSRRWARVRPSAGRPRSCRAACPSPAPAA